MPVSRGLIASSSPISPTHAREAGISMAEPRRLQSFHVGHKGSATRPAVYVRASPGSPEARAVETSASTPTGGVEETERCLLRNILRCFHFLDCEDRGYVSPAEAITFIAPLKHANPGLFELFNEVLAVTKSVAVDGRIRKERFIGQLESSLRALAPDDTSPLAQLRQPRNAVSRYFGALGTVAGECADGSGSSPIDGSWQIRGSDQYNDSQGGYNCDQSPHCTDATQPRDVQDSQSDAECTFKPVTNRRRVTAVTSEANVGLKEEIRDMHRLQYGNEPKDGMSEYIVFHFSEREEWPQDLRSLQDRSY
ncbi:integrin beta-1-like isoform X2, putative [Babesia ovata]|uniref:Integrin beta-1-like isoform X2, putative n=1 Tax=Babesia ovata TaxID=189622 RepID=A0A2H6KHD8_9APIC|nr:integrin beta-1-like isoform X2, putative [Babesia ovata]GBE62403.1 integrin beta-1-like isoform X2, putative [Babesia ovata]